MTDTDKLGVYGKYILKKANGGPLDSEACYFILRLDTDKVARQAMRVYAEECGNQQLSADIKRCLNWLDDPPACTCGGGRDTDVLCPFHDGSYWGHPVWTYGEGGLSHD